ncbi:MAG TPA: serine hydrolase domain-containing protein, partial [Thermoanaerobaculia bacterium]|nr:serine hydrolase domain-containing protein [Thermoanaerobaculia bacterium]
MRLPMRPARLVAPVLLGVLACLAVPAAAAPADPLAGWDALVGKALADWKTPGVSMVIVRGNDVLLLKGYGLRDVEKNLPVTPKTLFAIGSATKAFTTFVMGTLADEGKLDWNAPVSSYIPGFKLKDPVASERLTPTDLVTHRSGLPRHDALWYNATLSRKEMVERLRYLEPSKDFRTDFQYNNAMFLTAGYLVEQVTGTTWEEAVRARVFVPLGMTGANFSVLDSQKAPDFALPYEERDDKVQRMEFRNITNIGPAGSINASVSDLAPWLKVHVNGGALDGQRIVS